VRKWKDPDPDPYLWLMYPGPGGPKTFGSGFPTLFFTVTVIVAFYNMSYYAFIDISEIAKTAGF
jgi:hypothetical protein